MNNRGAGINTPSAVILIVMLTVILLHAAVLVVLLGRTSTYSFSNAQPVALPAPS